MMKPTTVVVGFRRTFCLFTCEHVFGYDYYRSKDNSRRSITTGYIIADLFVQDVDKSIQFYCDVLGFTFRDKSALPGEAPFWGWVSLGDCELMFSSRESAYTGEFAKPAEFRQALENNRWGIGVTINFRYAVPDLEAYYAQVTARGATILTELQTTSYGWQHFMVEDVDGYRIGFSIDMQQ